MSDQSSELVEISKLNGDFRRNYGKLIGAYLFHLISIRQCRARPFLVLGRPRFLSLFFSFGLVGATWLAAVNLVLISRITPSKLSTCMAFSRAKVISESVTQAPVPVPHEAGISRESLTALLSSFSRSTTRTRADISPRRLSSAGIYLGLSLAVVARPER